MQVKAAEDGTVSGSPRSLDKDTAMTARPDPTPRTGLTPDQAQARLAAEGFNELPRTNRRAPLRIVLDVRHIKDFGI